MNNFYRRNLLFVLIGLSSLAFFSCASTKFEGKAALVGRVCDMQGNPVVNYHVFLGSREALTDSGGMFVFRDVYSDSYHLTGGGNGWCALNEQIEFYDRKMVVCVQVRELGNLLEEIDSFLSADDVSFARDALESSKKYNEKNPLFLTFRALLSYGENPSEKQKNFFLSALEKL